MTSWWLLVAGLGALTVLTKAAGVLVLSERALPEPVSSRLALIAPALFAAFVATQTFLEGEVIVADARIVGVAVGGLAMARGAPLWAGVAAAAGTTALLRASGWL